MEKKLLGYMVTWTTYGTWLQGDERGYVKEGQTLPRDDELKAANQKQQKFETIKLNTKQKQIAEQAILQEAQRVNHKVFALAVCSNHVHLLVENSGEPIDQVVRRYKAAATMALRTYFPDKIWTKGYDKRFCFSQEDFKIKIQYVNRHNNI